MNVIVIASVVIAFTLLVGAFLAVVVRGFSGAVTKEQVAVESEKSSYNPSISMGYAIPVKSDYEEQLTAARLIAAKQAASVPRGSNAGIGSLGEDQQPTAFGGIKADPITAVKIAHYHGWQGLQSGAQVASGFPAPTMKAPAQTAVPTKGADDLVPGVDYEYIEISDEMNPAEKRKARIANSKAKSVALKTLKESGGVSSSAPIDAPVADAPVAQTATAPTAPATLGAAPVAGVDFEVISITDDMNADDVRKARIANAKAKSAAMKVYKESGGEVGSSSMPQSVEAAPGVAESGAVAAAVAPESSPSPDTAGLPKPDYIEITEGMDAAELRQARIHNAKAKSAYNKALKAAGIDPATIDG